MGGLTRLNDHVKNHVIHTFFFSILAGALLISGGLPDHHLIRDTYNTFGFILLLNILENTAGIKY